MKCIGLLCHFYALKCEYVLPFFRVFGLKTVLPHDAVLLIFLISSLLHVNLHLLHTITSATYSNTS